MQTVYLLKDSRKSYNALLQLYSSADLSTNIIVVNKFYAGMLLLDKRVKTFPFIINTLPTTIGLIPKGAKVLPLDLFLQIRNIKNPKPIKETRHINTRTNGHANVHEKFSKYLHNPDITPSIPHKFHKRGNYIKQNNKCNYKVRKPLIKTVKESDGSINIIMK
jgi:ABC-type antimicrobial peptide transport system permease subunit